MLGYLWALLKPLMMFAILYIVFAMRQLDTELSFTPEWTEDISHVTKKSENDVLIPYKLSQTIGYFTPDGKIVSSIPYPSKASISENYYATYAENNKNAKVYNNKNSFVTNLNFAGFPFFDEDRLYVFLPGGCSFIQCNSNGEQMWRYEYFSPVTAFSSSKGGTASGFADGTICTFDEKGNIKNQFAPGGSRIPVILGIDISDDGEMTATICGQEKQRFVLSKKDGEHNKIIFHEYLENDQSHQVLVKFNRKNDVVYYDANKNITTIKVTPRTNELVEVGIWLTAAG